MGNNLFEFTGKLHSVKDEITIYSTRQSKEQRGGKIKSNAKNLSKIFGIRGRLTDRGNKSVITQKAKQIILYAASDSFWYQDGDLFATEKKPGSASLPSEKAAKETAIKFLDKNKLLLPGAKIYSTTYTTIAVNKSDSKKFEEYNTEVHVNIRYELDGLPIFGPGAKTRLSFVNSNKTSGVYHFWRNAEPIESKRKLLSPELALELFYKNFRFANLKKNESARGIIKSIELGYYAFPPTDVQNYLLPVYRIRGTIRTKEFPKYDFDHYVVAVKYSDNDVKSMGLSINGVKAMVF
jgi:regulatory protein YycI of two-component signal transduction system YycFG